MIAQQPSGWPSLAVPMEHGFVWTTPETLIVGGLVIFVTGFLLGLLCGWFWREGH
jgi:hypothetical protein